MIDLMELEKVEGQRLTLFCGSNEYTGVLKHVGKMLVISPPVLVSCGLMAERVSRLDTDTYVDPSTVEAWSVAPRKTKEELS